MGRLIMGMVAIAIVGYLGYRAMYGSMPTAQPGVSAPKQKLTNVKAAADRIEAQQEKQNDEALKKATAE